MFFVHTTPEKFENVTILGYSFFDLFFRENSVRQITWLSWRHRLRRAPFYKCFSSKQKHKAAIFKSLRRLKSVFEKLRSRDGLIWTVRLSVEMKAVFLHLSGVVRTGRNKYRGIEHNIHWHKRSCNPFLFKTIWPYQMPYNMLCFNRERPVIGFPVLTEW